MISPLRFGADAVEVCFECVAHNITVSCITAAQSGATAPATPAAFLAQSLAETLAALAMVHVMKPGHPMIFSNWPFVIDLRSGAFSGGGGEIALMNAASAQLSNWLGLVSGVASSMTDSKAIDAQYGCRERGDGPRCSLIGCEYDLRKRRHDRGFARGFFRRDLFSTMICWAIFIACCAGLR